jgi:hypothetical protein
VKLRKVDLSDLWAGVVVIVVTLFFGYWACFLGWLLLAAAWVHIPWVYPLLAGVVALSYYLNAYTPKWLVKLFEDRPGRGTDYMGPH